MNKCFCAVWLALHLAAIHAPAEESGWTPVFAEDLATANLEFGWVTTNWLVRYGTWTQEPDGLRKRGDDGEGILMLRLPVVHGAVRVAYEVMAPTAAPGDLSLVLGTEARPHRHHTTGAAFFGLGSRSNTQTRLVVPGQPPAESVTSLIATGHWHRVVVERRGGTISASVDGQPALTSADSVDGLAGPYIALYAWGQATFRAVQVWTRPDEVLDAYLAPAARMRTATFARAPLTTSFALPPGDRASLEPLLLYVATNGNDTFSGRLPAPNRDGTDGPLASPQAALAIVQRIKSAYVGLPVPIRIELRGGMHVLREPLRVTSARGGRRASENIWTEGDPVAVTLAAYAGETPVLSGGRRIANWTTGTINNRAAWVADLPDVRAGGWNFHQLWVNGERRHRPTLPRSGEFKVVDDARPEEGAEWEWRGAAQEFRYFPGNLDASWSHLGDIEIQVFNFWIDSRMRIRAIDADARRVQLDRPTLMTLHNPYAMEGAAYRVENVREALTEAGEWYLDRAEGQLYYLPRPGERMETTEVVAPVLEQLLLVAGDSPEQPVEEFHLDGLTFAHNEWIGPTNWSGSTQAANEVPGALQFTNTIWSSVRNCRITHVGTYGIELAGDCRDITLADNTVTDLGAGGIKVWHNTTRTIVTNNTVAHGGRRFASGVGILVGRSSGNQLLHNTVHDFYYSAISVGWRWGYAESDTYGNIVEYNHLYDIGHNLLSDMGGIYTLGMQPGTRLRWNRIHDVNSRSYGGWGIYMDEGSSYQLIENNLCYRCETGGFNQHYGRENVVQNNIFAFSATNVLSRGRFERHSAFTFTRNITVSSHPYIWEGQWPSNQSACVAMRNLYWVTSGEAARFSWDRVDFANWQARGLDQGSRLADPRFVDPAADNFTLRPDSPALQLGFVPFDVSTAGAQ